MQENQGQSRDKSQEKRLKCYQATTTREKDVLHRHICRTATYT